MPRSKFQPNVSNFNDSVSPSNDISSFECELPSGIVNSSDPKQFLNSLRLKNINRLIFAHLFIKSLRNKFDSLVNVTNNNADILMISETELDSSFSVGQFLIHVFSKLYRLDRNSNGGRFRYISMKIFPQNLIIPKVIVEGALMQI